MHPREVTFWSQKEVEKCNVVSCNTTNLVPPVIPDPVQLYCSPLPVSQSKLADLRQTISSGLTPNVYQPFYDSLIENDADCEQADD